MSIFNKISGWWKSLSWRKPLWRYIRGERDELIDEAEEIWEGLEPAVGDIMNHIVQAGGKEFRDYALRAIGTVASDNKTGAEKFATVRKDLWKTFRYFAENQKESALDTIIQMLYEQFKREAA